jgi:FdrA protein
MSAVILNRVRKGLYIDSVALMRFSRSIAGLDGVEEAALMMGTPANLGILKDAGLLDGTGEGASGGDLVVAIRASDAAQAEAALVEAERLLDQPRGSRGEGAVWRPRSLRAAVAQMPDASLALISVPGDFAVAEARKAIRRGLHAMIFSDNVPLAEEVALKREATELGRLVMGPDCGTAIINGVPLAFANRLPQGSVGIIGASGTGIQEVSCLIARLGGGISHAIGVGGRDLGDVVGGISTLAALDMLARDKLTGHVVMISKPPSPEVTARVLARAGAIGKPVTVCFIGAAPMAMPANAEQVFTLKDAALKAVGIGEETTPRKPDIPAIAGRRGIRGLFSGGTLCAEAQAVLLAGRLQVTSNAPIPGALVVGAAEDGHLLLDLGDDAYTRGRPHPMIDPEVRGGPVREAMKDPALAVLLADVVIGHGAHPDPAGGLARAVTGARGRRAPLVIASVTGSDADPQIRSAQVSTLEEAGILVAPSNADAAAWARDAVGS